MSNSSKMLKGQSNSSKRGAHRKTSDVPMKVRRRQSDARWRANVASCYETLKHVIPMNIRASKRQISKAFILQETAKHINFLEDVMFRLLQAQGDMECEHDDQTGLCERRVADIKEEFIDLQQMRLQLYNERRSKKPRHKSANNTQNRVPPAQSRPTPTQSKSIPAQVRPIPNQSRPPPSTPTTPRTLTNPGKNIPKKRPQKAPKVKKMLGSPRPASEEVEVRDEFSKSAIPKRKRKQKLKPKISATPSLPDSEEFLDYHHPDELQLLTTPRKNDRINESVVPVVTPNKINHAGGTFTPVKLPASWDTPVKMQCSGTPQSVSERTESAYESDDNFPYYEGQDLTCSENMWVSDDEEEAAQHITNEQTPRNIERDFDLSEHVHKRRRTRLVSETSEACVPDLERERLKEMARRMSPSPRCRRSLQKALDLPEFEAGGPNLCCSESSSPIDPILHPSCSFDQFTYGLDLSSDNQTPSSSSSADVDREETDDVNSFEGYMLFYRNTLAEIEKSLPNADTREISPIIYRMWSDMDSGRKQKVIEAAQRADDMQNEPTLYNSPISSNSVLSDDLRDVQLSPIDQGLGSSESGFDRAADLLYSNSNDFDCFDLNATDEPLLGEPTPDFGFQMIPTYYMTDLPMSSPIQVVPEDTKVPILQLPPSNELLFPTFWTSESMGGIDHDLQVPLSQSEN